MIIRTNRNVAAFDKTFLSDSRLSWKAKGVLAFLLAEHDNISDVTETLIDRSKDGRDAVYSALQELETAGYIERERIRGAGGRYESIVTVVYEWPGGGRI